MKLIEDMEILRTPSEEVSMVTPAIRSLIGHMKAVIRKNSAAGIAAPQLGVLKRVAIVVLRTRKFLVMINPKLTYISSRTLDSVEGCLSLPKKLFRVRRAERVQVHYIDESGNPAEILLQGFDAVAAQHEIDHLDGILIDSIGERVL